MSDKKTKQRDDRGRRVSDETVLRVTKEVVVKFIEVGRLSPANFAETFAEVHRVVREAAGGDTDE
jgi:hypothetical protein